MLLILTAPSISKFAQGYCVEVTGTSASSKPPLCYLATGAVECMTDPL